MTTRGEPGQEKYEIDLLRLYLSVRWSTPLLPFEQRKLASLLPDEGYVLDERLDQPSPASAYQELSGTIARKGATSLTMDAGRPTLALEARKGQSVVEEFKTIEEVLRNGLSFDSAKHSSFYEALAQALVWTKQDAIAVLRKLGTAELIASRFSEKTGMGPGANVALRLVPLRGEMNSEDWWDVHIEPSFRSPHQCYRVEIVYRNPERDKVIQLAKNVEQVIHTCVELLEESNA